jgi:hypothetical protein
MTISSSYLSASNASLLPKYETPVHRVGNPFLMITALDDLDRAFRNVITILEEEDKSENSDGFDHAHLQRFRIWRDDLERLRRGDDTSLQQTPDQSALYENEGGMFID